MLTIVIVVKQFHWDFYSFYSWCLVLGKDRRERKKEQNTQGVFSYTPLANMYRPVSVWNSTVDETNQTDGPSFETPSSHSHSIWSTTYNLLFPSHVTSSCSSKFYTSICFTIDALSSSLPPKPQANRTQAVQANVLTLTWRTLHSTVSTKQSGNISCTHKHHMKHTLTLKWL